MTGIVHCTLQGASLGRPGFTNGLSGFMHLTAANKGLCMPRKMLGQSEF
jgi:hypothetical protein